MTDGRVVQHREPAPIWNETTAVPLTFGDGVIIHDHELRGLWQHPVPYIRLVAILTRDEAMFKVVEGW